MKIIILLALILLPYTAHAGLQTNDLIVLGKITMSKGGNTSTIDLDDEGNVFISGNGFKHDGKAIVVPSEVTYITAAGGITVTDEIMILEGDGGAVDITANPQIADGLESGDRVSFFGNSETNYIQFDQGDGLKLAGGISFKMKLEDCIRFSYNADLDIWKV